MPTDADSIFQPPSSDVERAEVRAGDFGSVQRGLAGDFTFGIQDVMSEAWQLTSGSKGVLFGGAFIAYAIAIGVGLGIAFAPPPLGGEDPGALGFLAQQVLNFLYYPLFAGMILYAVKRAANDQNATFADVFACYQLIVPIFGLYLLQTVLVLLGALLLILPGIYLGVAYWLAVPLLVDKQLGVWESLETSRKAITRVWFRFFALTLVVGFATGIGGVLTLGIGFIWLIPWAFLCIGVAYRKIFGYGPEAA